MPIATFYIINEESPQSQQEGLNNYVLYLVHHFVAQGANIYINASSKAEAENWGEIVFQQDAENLIPYNLIGEGPRNGTALEIGHSALKPSWNRNIVINLAQDTTIFARSQSQVIDFVPCDEKLKQASRERYKLYREAGFEMQTITIDHP